MTHLIAKHSTRVAILEAANDRKPPSSEYPESKILGFRV